MVENLLVAARPPLAPLQCLYGSADPYVGPDVGDDGFVDVLRRFVFVGCGVWVV